MYPSRQPTSDIFAAAPFFAFGQLAERPFARMKEWRVVIHPKNQPGSQVTGGKRRSQTPAIYTHPNPSFLQGPVILRAYNQSNEKQVCPWKWGRKIGPIDSTWCHRIQTFGNFQEQTRCSFGYEMYQTSREWFGLRTRELLSSLNWCIAGFLFINSMRLSVEIPSIRNYPSMGTQNLRFLGVYKFYLEPQTTIYK